MVLNLRAPIDRLVLCAALSLAAGGATAEGADDATPAWAAPRPARSASLRVIEVPVDSALPRARKHHALTWRKNALSRALGNGGLAGADCSNRVRLPSRTHTVAGQGSKADIKLQFAIGCSF